MPILDYPFHHFPGQVYPYPALPVRIVNPDSGVRFETYGLIDTGADASIIPGHIASFLDHNVRRGRVCDGSTGSGNEPVYEHTCRIDILRINDDGTVSDDVVIKIPARGKYIGILEHCPLVLLGVSDFLHRYIVTINYPHKVFSIRRPPRKS